MQPTAIVLLLSTALTTTASPFLKPRQSSNTTTTTSATPATFDGQCFYPVPTDDDDFSLTSYLGRWYQVAGTPAPFTSECKCISATYSLNTSTTPSTINVLNSCQLSSSSTNQEITIQGSASIIDEDLGYGDQGAFRVLFPGQSEPECPGPNYIVQAYDDDEEDGWAIVQAANFSTMFLLSREQNPSERRVNRWLRRAGDLGTNLTEVVRFNQTGCSSS